MTKKNKFHFLVYLGFLSIVGFLATDMYLPAFDVMRQDFETTKTNIGITLTLFLGGFAFAQIFWGPISDKYGKPKSIIIGLSLYALASLGIYFTHSIALLFVFRIVQAVGGCAAAVNWQALVVERYSEEETNKVFASIMPLVALSPAIAPLIGVFLLEHVGWRHIFTVLAVLALLLIVYTFTLIETDKKKKGDEQAIYQESMSYFSFFKSNYYIGNVILYAFCSAGFFAWLTGAPFFLKDLGYNEAIIGYSFIPQTIAFMLGGYGYRFLSDKVKGNTLLPYLLVLYSICMMCILGLTLFTSPTLIPLLIPFSFMALANGATYPIVVAEALKPFKNNSGKASALLNFLQLGASFLASALVSLFSNSLLATSAIMVGTIIFVALGYIMVRKENIFNPKLEL